MTQNLIDWKNFEWNRVNSETLGIQLSELYQKISRKEMEKEIEIFDSNGEFLDRLVCLLIETMEELEENELKRNNFLIGFSLIIFLMENYSQFTFNHLENGDWLGDWLLPCIKKRNDVEVILYSTTLLNISLNYYSTCSLSSPSSTLSSFHRESLGNEFVDYLFQITIEIEYDDDQKQLFLSILQLIVTIWDIFPKGEDNPVTWNILHHESKVEFGQNFIALLNRRLNLITTRRTLDLFVEIFNDDRIADNFFYWNDIKILIDVLVRDFDNYDEGEENDTLRCMSLQVIQLILERSEYRKQEVKHRPQDIMKFLIGIQRGELNLLVKQKAQQVLEACISILDETLNNSTKEERKCSNPSFDLQNSELIGSTKNFLDWKSFPWKSTESEELQAVLNNVCKDMNSGEIGSEILDSSMQFIDHLVGVVLECLNSREGQIHDNLIAAMSLLISITNRFPQVFEHLKDSEWMEDWLLSSIQQKEDDELHFYCLILLNSYLSKQFPLQYYSSISSSVVSKMLDLMVEIEYDDYYRQIFFETMKALIGIWDVFPKSSENPITWSIHYHPSKVEFGQNFISLLNRGLDPLTTKRTLNLFCEIFNDDSTADNFFYWNDIKVLIDILMRDFDNFDKELENDTLRCLCLEVMSLVVIKSQFRKQEVPHRGEDMINFLFSVIQSEILSSQVKKKAQEVIDLWQNY
eukprot:TRINITY_DN5604_c0_g1_i1.p1 TRINITY_DN5604_c0_g1~~TRINITY_DN5604_c0_g1_i1.p1  ORF type:complete len:693 (-),score=176.43 TRINITY_DN5604_c0_g1_i1:41-2119(-)